MDALENAIRLYCLCAQAERLHHRIWRHTGLEVDSERYERLLRKTLERMERRRAAYHVAVYGHKLEDSNERE